MTARIVARDVDLEECPATAPHPDPAFSTGLKRPRLICSREPHDDTTPHHDPDNRHQWVEADPDSDTV